MEVMIAAVVLGFLIIGLNRLQSGNREAVLRVRTRDAAQIVAQNFIDSLSRQGVSSVDIVTDKKDTVFYEWKSIENDEEKIIDKRPYIRNYTISVEKTLNSVESSNYARIAGIKDTLSPAKKVDLKVKWPFKNSWQEINVLRVIK